MKGTIPLIGQHPTRTAPRSTTGTNAAQYRVRLCFPLMDPLNGQHGYRPALRSGPEANASWSGHLTADMQIVLQPSPRDTRLTLTSRTTSTSKPKTGLAIGARPNPTSEASASRWTRPSDNMQNVQQLNLLIWLHAAQARRRTSLPSTLLGQRVARLNLIPMVRQHHGGTSRTKGHG